MGLNLSATRFAHLLGPLARSQAAARAEDDDKKDDDDKDAAHAEADDNDDKNDDDKEKDGRARKSKRSKKARAEDDDSGDEGKHAEDDDDDARAESDDDKKDDDDKDTRAKAARLAERARCAAIFRSEAAGKRPDVAAHLAFDTGMQASAAVSLLSTIASGEDRRGPDRLSARMAAVRLPALATDGGTVERDGPQAAAAFILSATRHARGEE